MHKSNQHSYIQHTPYITCCNIVIAAPNLTIGIEKKRILSIPFFCNLAHCRPNSAQTAGNNKKLSKKVNDGHSLFDVCHYDKIHYFLECKDIKQMKVI